jgi:hypothetical protein
VGEEPAPTSTEELRALLHSPDPWDNLNAIEAMVSLKTEAAPLVNDLLGFLTSERYVSCNHRKYEFSGHAILAEDAAGMIEWIGAPPDREKLRALMADRRIIIMPEASYDQGAYIGDYSSTTFSPAGLASRLVPLLGQNAFALLPELIANAFNEAEEIGRPARRGIRNMVPVVAAAAPRDRETFVAEIDRIAALPEVATPRTHLGFDLRDLARDCRRLLAKAAPPPSPPVGEGGSAPLRRDG